MTHIERPWHDVWAIREDLLPTIASRLRAHDVHGELEASDVQLASRERGDTTITGGVAILPLQGVITPRLTFLSWLFGGNSLQSFRASLREALADEGVSSILIDIDSPGGSSALILETAAEIRRARDVKPIVAIANTQAGSAAYWLAAQAGELVVTPSGSVGSIGAYCLHDDISSAQEQVGIKTTVVKAGKYKAELLPYAPLSEEAHAALQQRVDECHAQFIAGVATGRGLTEAKVGDGFGEGRMVTADQAVAEGMADRVGTFEETVVRLVRGDGPAAGGTAATALQRSAQAQTPPGQLTAEDRRALLDVALG